MTLDKHQNKPNHPTGHNPLLRILLKPFPPYRPKYPGEAYSAHSAAAAEVEEMKERMRDMTMAEVNQAIEDQRGYIAELGTEIRRAEDFLNKMVRAKQSTW